MQVAVATLSAQNLLRVLDSGRPYQTHKMMRFTPTFQWTCDRIGLVAWRFVSALC